MSKNYIIDATQQQFVYNQLQSLAGTHLDADSTKGAKHATTPDPLTDIDVYMAATDKSSTSLELNIPDTKKSSLVSNPDVLKRVYAALCERDTDRNGKIDVEFLNDDVSVNYDEKLSLYSEKELEQRLIEQYAGSVFAVKIVYDGPTPDGGSGTGFILKRFDNHNGTFTYHVITNAHVADDKDYAEAYFNLVALDDTSRFEKVKLIGVGPLADLAVLEFTAPVKLTECLLATNEPSMGETVVEIGNTKGRGVDSLAGDVVDLSTGSWGFDYNDGDNYPFRLYKIQNVSQPGNSGSPVFNLDGKVIGDHNMGIGEDLQGIITADRIQKTYENIIAHKDTTGTSYANWGIYPEALSLEKRQALLPEDKRGSGILISRVFAGSPAEKAGIKAGDILLSVNRDTTPADIIDEGDMYRFNTVMLDSTPGKKLNIEICRHGEQGIRCMTLPLVPEARLYKPMPTYNTNYGFNVIELTDTNREIHGIPPTIKGVRTHITTQIPTLFENLMNFDIITAVNGIPTPDVATFKTVFDAAVLSGQPTFLTTYKSAIYYDSANGGNGTVEFVVLPAAAK